jgi:hypothetical protein
MDSGKTTYVMSLYETEWSERGYGLWNNYLGTVQNVFDACRYITRASGRGLDPGCREFFGPCEMASNIEAQITRKLLPDPSSALK